MTRIKKKTRRGRPRTATPAATPATAAPTPPPAPPPHLPGDWRRTLTPLRLDEDGTPDLVTRLGLQVIR